MHEADRSQEAAVHTKPEVKRSGWRIMSWRRKVFEAFFWVAGKISRPAGALATDPKIFFIIQRSHIGDLLVNTPLLEALRKLYPRARIVAGVGKWNLEVLANNPNIDETIAVNVPWNNMFVSPKGLRAALQYIFRSEEVRSLRKRRFVLGIDAIGTDRKSTRLN